MTTIAYDRPVRNLIAGLDATGHVTHTQHRKDKVTLHHNGGRLSHDGVLSVWQTRPASAHFNVDAPGTVAQYVRVNEYAWATGSTEGNQRSISIEMCNETVGPEWRVGEATWREAARLAGWLFARVIGTRPTRDNLVVHKYWFATACAGPYVDRIYGQILSVAQSSYDRFIGGGDDMADVPQHEWNTVRDQIAQAAEGRAEAWPAGAQFLGELAWRNAVTAKLDALGKAATNVKLDPAQLEILRTDIQGIGEDVENKLDEAFANIELDADLGDDDIARIKDAFKTFMYTQMFVLAPKPPTGL